MRRAIFLLLVLFGWSCESDDSTTPTPETSTVTDAAGTVYKTVKIGDQWWLAEDLRVTRFNNGDPITFISEYDSAGWVMSSSAPAFCNYPGQSGTTGSLYKIGRAHV